MQIQFENGIHKDADADVDTNMQLQMYLKELQIKDASASCRQNESRLYMDNTSNTL